MDDKPLDQAELDLLDLIRQLHAEKGPFLRSTLSVIGRGRGLDVARPFNRLKSLGLVEEVERRPFFLKRLFGVKPTILLQPRAPELPAVVPEGNDESAAITTETSPHTEVKESVPPTLTLPQEPAFDSENASSAPEAELIIEPVAAVSAEPVASPVKPAPSRQRRLPPDAYTDDIGGQPIAYTPLPLAVGLDPELLDGMREMLELLGMELTMAGEAMISNRMAKGASAGESLCQVALFAFAHAVHHDQLVGGTAQPDVLHDYAIEVIRELEKLRDAGEVGSEPFERDMRAIWALADKDGDRAQLVASLLSDPVGGAAPPALLPEEVRGLTEYED